MESEGLGVELCARLHGTIFYGDPHGRWEPLLDSLSSDIRSVIILGDLAEAKRHPDQVDAARSALDELTARGLDWHTISGNHDSDTPDVSDFVYGELGDRLFDGRVVSAGYAHAAVAGLGGVVRGRVWDGGGQPVFRSPAALLAQTPRQNRHRGGLPFKMLSTIFPATVDALAALRADVLVSHEAPSCHPHGFAFVDDLAAQLGACLIVHGHHHESYSDRLENGTAVRGLGLAEVWRPFDGGDSIQEKLFRAGLKSLAENDAAYRALKDR